MSEKEEEEEEEESQGSKATNTTTTTTTTTTTATTTDSIGMKMAIKRDNNTAADASACTQNTNGDGSASMGLGRGKGSGKKEIKTKMKQQRPHARLILSRLLATLRKRKRKSYKIRPILKAKIPLLKIVDKSSKLVFDVTCAGKSEETERACRVIRSSINAACTCVRAALLVLKSWASKEYLLAPANIGCRNSSYPFTLLLLSHFQMIPSRQGGPLLRPLETINTAGSSSGRDGDRELASFPRNKATSEVTSAWRFADGGSLGRPAWQNTTRNTHEKKGAENMKIGEKDGGCCPEWFDDSKLQHACSNVDHTETFFRDLLLGFFEAHAPGGSFNPEEFYLELTTPVRKRRSATRGGPSRKKDVLVIEDPVRRGVNLARKVSAKVLHEFRKSCRNAQKRLVDEGLTGIVNRL
eukprot:jgi/Bigna1/85868/estExt_fgenesh1_pg.C_60309